MGEREILPNRRALEHVDLVWSGTGFTVGLGAKEVFISSKQKAGSALDCAARDIAILMSLLLQYHCPPDVIERALTKDAKGRRDGLAGEIARLL
jgi:hypothetical protein